MSGRHGRTTPSGPGRRQPSSEADAAETATAIAGLRARLKRVDIWHPAVLSELHKLDEQLVILLDQADQAPGAHRSPAGTASGEQISDAWGYDLKPDPLTATTPAEFITVLWRYKAWSGNPSWRKMAVRARQAVVHSTMHAAMHGQTLPKFDVMRAIVVGCGGSSEDLKAFATAWRRIESSTAGDPRTISRFLTAPLADFLSLSTAGRN